VPSVRKANDYVHRRCSQEPVRGWSNRDAARLTASLPEIPTTVLALNVVEDPDSYRNRRHFFPSHAGPGPRGHIGRIVAGSLVTGLVVGLLLVAAPFIPAKESQLTGALLCGFALGWAMLAVLSVRFSDQPQRWAAAPALFMGLGGLLLAVFGSKAHEVLSWLWPPALLALVVWMATRAHRELHSRTRQWLIYPVIAMLALAAVGGGYQTVSGALDEGDLTMPGQLIDVGGHSLHLSCSGSGGPTVVLEPGAGETSSAFRWIAPAVARDTRVCVYDRAGRGWSDPADTPQDAAQIANDLHTLLQRGQVPGPYVLAGHSFGGLYVLTFAARFPDEVAGMVLVDPTAPASDATQVKSPDNDGSYDIMRRVSALLSSSARLGLGRLVGLDYGSVTVAVSHLQSTIDEYTHTAASTRQAAALGAFGDKPLVILIAGTGSDAAWIAAREDLATLSTNSVHRVIDGANHQQLVTDESAAATTTRAVLDVVKSIRNDEPLVR
jgi:pimeloyl-ACP methyl ester carboxylesterase